jgi:hypothetical protein
MSREDVKAMARSLLSLEAHYLTGAFGGIPDQPDSVFGRSITLLNDCTWQSLSVCAAEYENRRCCGRYRVPNRKLQLPQGSAIPPEWETWFQTVLRPDSPRDTPFRGCYPRRHVVERRFCPIHQDEATCHPKWVYLGDNCEGKIHFDCCGFLGYVFWRALGRIEVHPISGWRALATPCRPADADIVLSDRHIAIALSPTVLIHANGDRRGVETTGWQAEYLPYRLRDNMFQLRATVSVP